MLSVTWQVTTPERHLGSVTQHRSSFLKLRQFFQERRREIGTVKFAIQQTFNLKKMMSDYDTCNHMPQKNSFTRIIMVRGSKQQPSLGAARIFGPSWRGRGSFGSIQFGCCRELTKGRASFLCRIVEQSWDISVIMALEEVASLFN